MSGEWHIFNPSPWRQRGELSEEKKKLAKDRERRNYLEVNGVKPSAKVKRDPHPRQHYRL